MRKNLTLGNAKVDEDGKRQLATRIPRRLRKAVNIYCAEADEPIEAFVRAALEERLERVAP